MGLDPPYAALAALFALALATPLSAGGLDGRKVVFTSTTWDDPALPLFTSSDYGAVVGPGPEFDMARESGNGLAVVPVRIDLSAEGIVLSYEGVAPGRFAEARFNGYVLRFPTDCALVTAAEVDPGGTTLPLKPDALGFGARELTINVAGLFYGPESRIAIRLEVADCPLS